MRNNLQSVSSQAPFLLLVLSLLAVSVYSQGNQFCPLCATQADLPARWDYRLSDGRTCRDVYLYLASISSSNAMCQPTKNMAQQACCSATAPPPTGSNPSPTPPAYSGPVGNEPICPICGTMEYPGIPQGFVVARYVGEFTCHQLYGRGLNGMIPNYMCGPLQDFSKVVCGCGRYNPKCQANPNQCWGSSGNSPVASPVASPVSQPVQSTSYSLTAGNNRKTQQPGGSKYRLSSNNRGGSTRMLRGGELDEENEEEIEVVGETEEPTQVQDKDLHFEVGLKTDE